MGRYVAVSDPGVTRGPRRLACAVAAWAALVMAAPAWAQQPAAAPAAPAAELPPLRVSPRGALVRAMLVPGWGHAAIGSYTRGGFYFALEAATLYTFVRTSARLSDARERAALRETAVRAGLAREGVTDPTTIETRVDADQTLQGLRDLVDSRKGHREDLIAWSIFLIFLSGADAYVSAHLSRFPTPIELETQARPDGRADVTLRVAVPF